MHLLLGAFRTARWYFLRVLCIFHAMVRWMTGAGDRFRTHSKPKVFVAWGTVLKASSYRDIVTNLFHCQILSLPPSTVLGSFAPPPAEGVTFLSDGTDLASPLNRHLNV